MRRSPVAEAAVSDSSWAAAPDRSGRAAGEGHISPAKARKQFMCTLEIVHRGQRVVAARLLLRPSRRRRVAELHGAHQEAKRHHDPAARDGAVQVGDKRSALAHDEVWDVESHHGRNVHAARECLDHIAARAAAHVERKRDDGARHLHEQLEQVDTVHHDALLVEGRQLVVGVEYEVALAQVGHDGEQAGEDIAAHLEPRDVKCPPDHGKVLVRRDAVLDGDLPSEEEPGRRHDGAEDEQRVEQELRCA
mmetsp:Transcript_58373/g.153289  ORF Transcript_58373/g.153289 Transcript_58373/m.153289 type:complete len:249 (+) Transcript_58373:136-882(+)